MRATTFGLLRSSLKSWSRLYGLARLVLGRGLNRLFLGFAGGLSKVVLALREHEEDHSAFIVGHGLLADLGSSRLGGLLLEAV